MTVQPGIRRLTPRLPRSAGRVRFAAPEGRLAGGGPKRLVSSISHDFAQPLSTVTSLADLLATDWRGMSDTVRRDLATRIDVSARRLATRYGHIVVLLDVLAGRINSDEQVPVRDVVEAVVAQLPTHVRVGVSGPMTRATIDRGHLEHVVSTLVFDAVAYGIPPIRVRVIPYADGVRVEVSDHGQDVLRRTRAHVWTPRTGGWTLVGRETPRARALGLAVAARLVATDGGMISRRPMRRRRGERVIVRLATTEKPER